MKARVLVFVAALSAACRSDPPPAATTAAAPAWLVLRAAGDAVDFGTLRVEPAAAVEQRSRQGTRFVLAIRSAGAGGTLRIDTEQSCPLSVPLSELVAGRVLERELVPWLDFGGPYSAVGFDKPVAIDVRAGCPEAAQGRIEWRLVRGSAPPMRVEARGFRLELSTPRADASLDRDRPWGIVPISPRTRGALTLEATWSGPRPGGGMRQLSFALEVSAAHRSRGLPNLALGTRALLSDDGWRVVAAPSGASELALRGDVFEPDRPGRWLLEDRRHQQLSVHAARYDETPLDCGRAECHASIAAAALKSPMASIFERELARGAAGYPACALGCHTAGERGVKDGGFSHVAAEIGLHATDLGGRSSWDELPRDLRRLAGVGCLACHGPGAIPEPAARNAVLRSDVCAYCHDAPPRYGHVAAWRASAMARAGADSAARSSARCARCHTTRGFLEHQGARTASEPSSLEPFGIACAACHAVHATEPGGGMSPALLRSVRMPTLLTDQPVDPRARVCTPCHTPSVDEALPSASAAAMIAGRGGVDPRTGSPLEGAAPHAKVDGGCVGCHRLGPPGLERGAGHAFRATGEGCPRCHATLPAPQRAELRTRAAELWTKLERRLPPASPHSGPPHAAAIRADPRTALGRAARNALLVLEDPGAADHNLSYAVKLLDASERWLATPQP